MLRQVLIDGIASSGNGILAAPIGGGELATNRLRHAVITARRVSRSFHQAVLSRRYGRHQPPSAR